jgi:hypothetical protein
MELKTDPDGILPIGIHVVLPCSYNALPYYYRTIDPIVDLISYTYIPVGSYPMSLLTLDRNFRYGLSTILEKEKLVRLQPNDLTDRYLGSFGRFKLLFDVLGQTKKSTGPRNENSILHNSSMGNFIPDESNVSVPWGTTTYGTALFPSFSYPQYEPSYYGPATSIKKMPVTSQYVPIFPTSLTVKPHRTEVILQDLYNKVNGGTYGGTVFYAGWYSYTNVTNFSWSGDPVNGFAITYDFRWNFSDLESNVESNPKWGWTFSNVILLNRFDNLSGFISDMAVDTVRTMYSPVKIACMLQTETTSRYFNSMPYPNYSPSVGQVDTYTNTEESPISIGFPSYTSASSYNLVIERIRRFSGYEAFKDLCHDYTPDFRGAAFFSASDAMNNLLGSVGTNFLQSIPKLSGILDVLPDITGILNSLATLENDPIKSLADLLKISSGAYLKTIFGTRSNYELVVKYVPSLLEVLNDLSSLSIGSKNIIAHGSYSFALPEPFLPSSVLRVKSKLVVSDIPSEPLRSILGLNSLGILPTPQRLWDLVPLSFVVNWITNFGSILNSIQNLVIGQLVTTEYGVHSYTVESPIPVDMMTRMGVYSNGTSDCIYKYYRRELSKLLPSPSISRLEFYKAPGIQSWMTPAALIVQRLL